MDLLSNLDVVYPWVNKIKDMWKCIHQVLACLCILYVFLHFMRGTNSSMEVSVLHRLLEAYLHIEWTAQTSVSPGQRKLVRTEGRGEWYFSSIKTISLHHGFLGPQLDIGGEPSPGFCWINPKFWKGTICVV